MNILDFVFRYYRDLGYDVWWWYKRYRIEVFCGSHVEPLPEISITYLADTICFWDMPTNSGPLFRIDPFSNNFLDDLKQIAIDRQFRILGQKRMSDRDIRRLICSLKANPGSIPNEERLALTEILCPKVWVVFKRVEYGLPVLVGVFSRDEFIDWDRIDHEFVRVIDDAIDGNEKRKWQTVNAHGVYIAVWAVLVEFNKVFDKPSRIRM